MKTPAHLASMLLAAAEQVNPDEVVVLSQALGTHRVFVAAAGRSGLVARMFANRLVHLGREVHVVGEVTCPAITADDVLLVVSRSVTTPGPRAAAEQAWRIGARVVCLTQRGARVPSGWTSVELPVGGDEQPMGSGFEQLALLLLDTAVLHLMIELGVDEAAMRARHANLE